MADQSPPAPPLKALLNQIESIDNHVDHANKVALDNEIHKRTFAEPEGSIVPKTDIAGTAASGATRTFG